MDKQRLTKSEMLNRFHDYFGRAITFTMLAIIPTCVGGPIVLASFIVPVSIVWQVIGWMLIATAVGCLITSAVFFNRSSYWGNKAYEEPKWLKELTAKWRETHSQ